jgi:hypothetical protein
VIPHTYEPGSAKRRRDRRRDRRIRLAQAPNATKPAEALRPRELQVSPTASSPGDGGEGKEVALGCDGTDAGEGDPRAATHVAVGGTPETEGGYAWENVVPRSRPIPSLNAEKPAYAGFSKWS